MQVQVLLRRSTHMPHVITAATGMIALRGFVLRTPVAMTADIF